MRPRGLGSGRYVFGANCRCGWCMACVGVFVVVGVWVSVGNEDVCEYEPAGTGSCTTSTPTYNPAAGGCVSLISSGTASGIRVHRRKPNRQRRVLLAKERLVCQDTDTALDLYDAHICITSSPCPTETLSRPPGLHDRGGVPHSSHTPAIHPRPATQRHLQRQRQYHPHTTNQPPKHKTCETTATNTTTPKKPNTAVVGRVQGMPSAHSRGIDHGPLHGRDRRL